MVPFKETINTKQELIEACKKGFEDYSNKRISKNDFCMFFGFTHGEAITKFYERDYEQLLIDGGFNSGSVAYFAGGINAWKNLRDGKYVFPPFVQNNSDAHTVKKTFLHQPFSDSLNKDKFLPYLTALRTKPFMLLAGISGTGKSRIVREMAKACWKEGDEEYGKNHPKNFCMVQVKPNWHDSSELIGYVSRINGEKYVVGPFLRFMAKAIKDENMPYFLCLDEMNLAPVEQYFAEYLSVIESRKLNEDGSITTDPIIPFEDTEAYGTLIDQLFDTEADRVAYKSKDGKRLTIPQNLFVVGTVNMDETTFSFSRKVLDRANVIEFKIAPNEMEQYLNEKKDIHLEKAYSACSDMAEDFVNKANSQIQIDNNDEKTVLLSFFTELKKVNAEFGYRTVNEISRYLHFADGDLEDDSAIDTAILQKLLPKLHGSRKKLVPVLSSLWQLCLKDGIAKEIDAGFNKDDFKYPESAEKIQRMYNAVVDNGFTSFAEA